MRRIAHLLVHRAPVVLGATALLTLLAVAMLPRLAFDADVTSSLLGSTPEGQAFTRLQQVYDVGDPITVVLERRDGGSLTDREGLALVAEARDALAAVDGVASVGTLVPTEDPLLGQALDAERIRGLAAPLLAGLSGLLRRSPAAELLLSDDGTRALAVVLPDGDPIAVADRVPDAAIPDGLRAVFAGNPLVFAEVIDLLGWFLLAIPPAVILLILLVFTLALGAPRLAALSIVPAILGALWTFGLIFGLGLRVDIVTVIVPIFVIVMGSADGLHFVSHLQDAAERGEPKAQRVAAALREVGVPMILTTVSTAAGFLSLAVTGVRPMQQLGVFTAVGITFAGAISFFTLPALLSRIDIPARGPRARLGRRLTDALEAAASRRWIAGVVVAGMLVVAAAGIPRLAVVSDQLFFFKADHPVRAAYAEVEAAFGGASPLFGEFAFDPSAPIDPQLEAIRARSDELEDLPGIRSVVSVASLAAALPEAQRDELLRGERTPPVGPMVSAEGLRFLVFPDDVRTSNVERWREATDAMPEVRAFTGTPLLFEALNRLVVRAQAGSLALAFVLVGVLLLVVYRRLGTTLLALFPIAVTVATLLGFLALSGIQLNLITAIASSIVIGVGIDYAIHLIAALEHARADGGAWVRRALRTAGRPILANAIGIPVGLSALLASPFAPHTQIAALMWVAMLSAAATTLLILPALAPRQALVDVHGG